jgi:putative ABC transport system permease protein
MATFAQDLKYAVRTLAKAPGFALVSMLTLGLGIGANTAIFSVINAVLLRPFPYREPDRLVTVEHLYPRLNNLEAPVSVPGFRDYRAQEQVFERAAVETGWAPNLTGRGDPERLRASQVTGDWFTTYGVEPMLGRALRPDEAEAGHDKVVVLSHGFWQRQFGGDPAVLGQRLQLNNETYEIVGVMPAAFRSFWNRRAELWAPLVFDPDDFGDDRRTNEFLAFTGRLKPGVTVAQAQAEMHGLAGRLKADFTDSYAPDWDLLVTSLNEQARSTIRRALYVLLGAVGLVLLIACANVANLQLARAAGRTREIAIRVAMGASPRALARQLLTESVLLALLGGLVGLLLAVWGVPALLALNANNLPPSQDIRLDGSVLVFTLVVALVTGLLFGLAPALRVTKGNLHEALKEGSRGSVGDRGGLRLRRGLVVATVALALTLLAGAGLLIRSFAHLLRVDPGFQPEQVLTFNLSLPTAKYPSDTVQIALFERLTAEIAGLPGVTGVGGTSVLPFGGSWSTGSFSVEGYQAPENTPGPWGDIRVVTTGFLPTLDVQLIKGRHFTEQDGPGAPRVAIVDEGLVQRYWPNDDPIGKRITRGDPTDSSTTWIEVVGVVRHTMHEGLDGDRRVQVYFPLRQLGIPFLAFAVRTTAGDPMAQVRAVRAAIKNVDPDLPLSNVNTMEQLVEDSTGARRFSMVLLSVFSALAATLAAIGLYGVMSFIVTQRTRELGVRLALGAKALDVLGLVLRQGMWLVTLGVVLGLGAALVLTRVLQSMLFNLSATDPLTFLAISVLLVGVTLFATWLPARRATRVDPSVVLREE